jgi:hypothetical protein
MRVFIGSENLVIIPKVNLRERSCTVSNVAAHDK